RDDAGTIQQNQRTVFAKTPHIQVAAAAITEEGGATTLGLTGCEELWQGIELFRDRAAGLAQLERLWRMRVDRWWFRRSVGVASARSGYRHFLDRSGTRLLRV